MFVDESSFSNISLRVLGAIIKSMFKKNDQKAQIKFQAQYLKNLNKMKGKSVPKGNVSLTSSCKFISF